MGGLVAFDPGDQVRCDLALFPVVFFLIVGLRIQCIQFLSLIDMTYSTEVKLHRFHFYSAC